jgi:hypothetical protein
MSQSVLQTVPRRTKRLLEQLIATRQLEPAALEWLVACTDPFHDTDVRLQGFPDMSTSKSVTQCITLTMSLPLADGRDAHCFFLPFTQMYGLNPTLSGYNIRDNGFQGAANATTALLVPGVNWLDTPNGQTWYTNAATLVPNNLVKYPLDFGAGQARLVACGWEIVNTTPVVNMGGSITCYRSPNTVTQSYIGTSIGGAPPISFLMQPTTFGALPPGTQATAALFPNSRTWQSSEGLYQVAVMSSIDQNFRAPAPGNVGFINVPTQAQLAADLDRVAFLPTGSFSTGNTAAISNCTQMMNWDVSGCVIANSSGFTQQFQLTVKYYIERLPTVSDPNLLVLAHEPCPYDPLALEIYARATACLPVGVPVGENPLGEWFDQVMATVAGALPAVGTALATIFPPAAAIGAGLGGVALSVGQWNKKNREEEMIRRAEQSAKDKELAAANNALATKNLQGNSSVVIATKGGSSANTRRITKPLPKIPTRKN